MTLDKMVTKLKKAYLPVVKRILRDPALKEIKRITEILKKNNPTLFKTPTKQQHKIIAREFSKALDKMADYFREL